MNKLVVQVLVSKLKQGGRTPGAIAAKALVICGHTKPTQQISTADLTSF